MDKLHKQASAFSLVSVGVIFLLLGSFVVPQLGAIEGYFAPVTKVTDFRVLGEIEGDAVVGGLYNRFRTQEECQFRKSVWYKRPSAEIAIERLDELSIDDEGEGIPWGNLRLNVSPETAATEIYVHAYHQCHLLGIPLPWLTRTETWRSP